ncbi:Helix-turn-helix domain-containing protein [Microbulbifer donghaiensis]|uniref:Helix-turn-helix domain-containing protein n=1 Tax=Microbulbifer donghaiensis TaxID=494016 RepID=A0A1M5FPM6_9GAMM|nr:helix-turn-helix transcriptional regulator [Microbulbifer donghaiensis]SHF93453.1 Helix-turn-helix domain-containing protein [Microbulbifer donghaiensis]
MREEQDIDEFRYLGFRRFLPVGALSHRVECYWSTGSILSPQTVFTETLYPDGGASLSIDLGSPDRSSCFQFNSAISRSQFSSSSLILSIRFRPGALFHLFGISPQDCNDIVVPVQHLLTPIQLSRFFALVDSLTPSDVISSLTKIEEWLLEIELSTERSTGRVERALAQLAPTDTVESMAEAAGTSVRTLERQFRLEVGMTPSQVLQYRRMKLARAQLSLSNTHLAKVALICGFYDQAHFTRTFTRFVGETPSTYRSRKLSDIYKT